jgi:phosphoglycolate phosphatase-like HAD superfamily hydrolase
MRRFSEYDIYIFDCDGVILDSNALKIEAMRKTLCTLDFNESQVKDCVSYFSSNFGKSRFHHIDIFLSEILDVNSNDVDKYRSLLLKGYSGQCESLYLKANITAGFMDVIHRLKGKTFVASGSEQNELRSVFKQRELDSLFVDVYGSPTKKSDIVADILRQYQTSNAVMIGDALSDLDAAVVNCIDFVGYLPYSNVASALREAASEVGFSCIDSYAELDW